VAREITYPCFVGSFEWASSPLLPAYSALMQPPAQCKRNPAHGYRSMSSKIERLPLNVAPGTEVIGSWASRFTEGRPR
jgi:hypothetical protein